MFTLLFRLEKVYNLVNETMPKKLDGQSGVQDIGWAGPHLSVSSAGLGLGTGCVGQKVSSFPTDLTAGTEHFCTEDGVRSQAPETCLLSWVARRWGAGRTREIGRSSSLTHPGLDLCVWEADFPSSFFPHCWGS